MDAVNILNINSKQMILFSVGYDIAYMVKVSAWLVRGMCCNILMECSLCSVWYMIFVCRYLGWYEMVLNVWGAGRRCEVLSNTHHFRSPVLDREFPDVAGE